MVTALDGIDEYAREKVNKKFSNEQIIEKIKEAYEVKPDKRLSVKVYMIIGYPWEDKKSANLNELKYVLREADKQKKTHRILFYFLFTHFVPMQLTPMYNLPLNFIDYRKELLQKRDYLIYSGINIEGRIYEWITTPAGAFDNLYIERASENDYDNYIKIFNTKKYQSLPVERKIKIIEKYANPKLYEYNKNVSVDYLIPNYDFKKAVKLNE